MINSVQNISNVSFKASALDKVTPEMINHPGKYSTANPIEQAIIDDIREEKKKSGLFGKLVKFVLTVAVLAGAAVAVKRMGMNEYTRLTEQEFKDAKFLTKAKDKFYAMADYIDQHTIAKIGKRAPKHPTDQVPTGDVQQ